MISIKDSQKKYFYTIVSIGITITIFYYLFSKISFSSVLEILFTTNPIVILGTIFLLAITLGISGKRWQKILSAMNYPLEFLHCFRTYMASIPFSIITPAKAGDGMRAYYLRTQIPITRTIGGVLSERFIDLFILIMFSIIGLILTQSMDLLYLLLLMAGLCCGVGMLILWSHKLPIKGPWRARVENLSFSLKTIIANPNKLYPIILFSLIIWVIAIIQTYLFFLSLGIKIPFFIVMSYTPLAILIGMIPVSLGGMGTRDAAIILLFANYAPADQLLAVGILFSLIRYWIPGIIGCIFILQFQRSEEIK